MCAVSLSVLFTFYIRWAWGFYEARNRIVVGWDADLVELNRASFDHEFFFHLATMALNTTELMEKISRMGRLIGCVCSVMDMMYVWLVCWNFFSIVYKIWYYMLIFLYFCLCFRWMVLSRDHSLTVYQRRYSGVAWFICLCYSRWRIFFLPR